MHVWWKPGGVRAQPLFVCACIAFHTTSGHILRYAHKYIVGGMTGSFWNVKTGPVNKTLGLLDLCIGVTKHMSLASMSRVHIQAPYHALTLCIHQSICMKEPAASIRRLQTRICRLSACWYVSTCVCVCTCVRGLQAPVRYEHHWSCACV
jgi:hypothetical protein